jgi:hypothetical protein
MYTCCQTAQLGGPPAQLQGAGEPPPEEDPEDDPDDDPELELDVDPELEPDPEEPD